MIAVKCFLLNLHHTCRFLLHIFHRNPIIKHALEVRKASQQENYHKLMKLYCDAPAHSSFILDMALDVWRGKALQKIVKAYKPEVNTDFFVSELGFADDEEGRDFIRDVGGVFTNKSKAEIDTKKTVIDLTKVVGQDSLLL